VLVGVGVVVDVGVLVVVTLGVGVLVVVAVGVGVGGKVQEFWICQLGSANGLVILRMTGELLPAGLVNEIIPAPFPETFGRPIADNREFQ